VCGIAGIVGDPERVREPEARLKAMMQALRHRGPDDEGMHVEPGAALGHRRLSIIDLDGGHQPITNETADLWIVFNGEIYNFQELRDELEREGHTFATRTDTEAILHLYEQEGERCVERLRGMFAFVIWDRPRGRLFAARDHLGQKPFFYSERDGHLLFGSEIKAVRAADPTLSELDPAGLDQYLALRIIASPGTMFRGIRKLPPGHRLTYTPAEGVRVERFWRPDYEPKWEGSDDELVDQLEAHLIDTLRLHMVSDVPVGAFLSGGLDSTLVLAMTMRHVADGPIDTFSGSLPYRDTDEAPYARMVAERYGTNHHEITLDPSLIRLLPRLVWQMDEPSDALSVCSFLISELASRHVKVALGGDGGDELFGGYDRYYGNRYAGHFARIPRLLRRGIVGPVLDRLPDGGWYKSKVHQLKWLNRLSFLEGGERYAESLGYFYLGRPYREALYGPAMREALDAFDPEAAIREPYDHAPATDPVDRMLYADSQARLPDHSVMILDRMSMAHGLEARSPFMDHRLAEFAARLPVRMKVRGRSLRWIQVRLARRYLPDALFTRPKQGFASALPYLLRDEYRILFHHFLGRPALAEDGLIRREAVDRLLAEHLGGAADHGNRLWLLLNSEVWYRLSMRGDSVHEMTESIPKTLPRTLETP
jgi:asparagine synthase (glutamine-hydrolysing)